MASSTAATGNLHNVFVYGSLLADDVVRVLLNRVPDTSSAVLKNYQRFSIKGRVYPAIIPVANQSVTGRVLSGITDPELHILDVFEDVEYERTPVDVALLVESPLQTLQAHTYVWTDHNDPNLYGHWDFQEWEHLHKKEFLNMTSGFVQELENLPESESRARVATYEAYYNNNAAAANDNPSAS